MDNAVKALIIAAGVLIGIMIISLVLSLHASLNEFVEESQEKISIQEIQKFNEQFTRYINYDDAGNKEFSLRIQDIVTAANIAYENNTNSGNYVTINIKPGISNLETRINSDSAQILEEGLGNEYKCYRSDVKIDSTTGKVYEVTFRK